jgi:RNA polymerase sigma-70 factor (ECF subfamily)
VTGNAQCAVAVPCPERRHIGARCVVLPVMSEYDTYLNAAWRDHHRALLDVAYRVLGSMSEAEDAVQEAFSRLMRADRAAIRDVRGWLVVVTSRISLDQLSSARARRESYVGPWLPEPLLSYAPRTGDPADQITLDESVRMALLVVLEQMTPPERVAFILHDVFQLPFEAVGEVVGRTPAAARQLASRARRRVADADTGHPARFSVDAAQERAVADRFLAAAQGGDLAALTELLDPDVVMNADSGGLAQAPRRPISGRARIVKVFAHAVRTTPGLQFEGATVNGGPGLVARTPDRGLVAVVALVVADGRIRRLDLLANPEKLATLEHS